MIVRHAHRRGLHLNRRTVMLITVSIVVVLCAIIAIRFGLIAAAEAKAKTSLTNTSAAVKAMTDKLNTSLADTSQAVSSKVAAVGAYSTKLQDYSKDVCGDERTLIYYGFIAYHDNCEQAHLALFALNAASNNLYGFLSDEETLAALLPKNSSNLSYSQQYDLWTRTTGLLRAAKTGDQAQTLKDTLASAANNYAAAWNAVIQADTKKDEAAFNKAEELVKTTYTALQATSAISNKTLQDLTSVFNTKYTAYTALKLTK